MERDVVGTFARFDGHEQVVYGNDPVTGLRCIIAIHSTRLGPAIGGTRFRPYASEEEALADVLRLSAAMTAKASCAGLDAGGGKTVIIGDPVTDATEPLLQAYGRMIASLGGRYVTACDIGTTPDHMAVIGRETRWVTGMAIAEGGSGDSGVLTAHGVHLAMRAAAEIVFRDASLAGRHVAVQGLGKVGGRLVGHLVEEGAKVSVADVSDAAVERVAHLPGVDVVGVDDVLHVDADVVSPNALGAVLDATTVEHLQARIVCGGANNQLASPADGARLHERGILYAPDFVVNAGGLINVADELHPGGHDPARTRRQVETIPAVLERIVERSRAQDVPTDVAARRIAEERIEAEGTLRSFLLP